MGLRIAWATLQDAASKKTELPEDRNRKRKEFRKKSEGTVRRFGKRNIRMRFQHQQLKGGQCSSEGWS